MISFTLTRCTAPLAGAAALVLLALGACTDTTATTLTATPSAATETRLQSAERSADAGAVFVTTNGAEHNAVVAFARAANGALTYRATVATGGAGIGGTIDPLASQSALALSRDAHRLYVVNAGSGSVTTFAVSGADLTWLGTTPSGGTQPVSVAVRGRRLFVLNAGSNAIAEFSLNGEDVPAASPLATAPLGTPASGASTIGVAPDGRHVVVTERAANAVDVFTIGEDGTLSAPVSTPSSGSTPFGFAFTPRSQVVVSEAAGDAPNGAASSYRFGENGALALVSGSVSTHQAATCWLVVTESGRLAFAVNSVSGSISAYAVSADASLRLVDESGRTGISGDGAAPIDLGLSRGGRFLYVLEAGTGTIGAFAVGHDGHLASLPDTPGLTAASGLQGLAAY
jgi:6-phosphogluconolactonase (cycloisomerase 2 family)